MPEPNEHVTSKADALAQIQEAEAEVAEAEALASAARARARAARLKREALALADDAEDYADAAAAAADVAGVDDSADDGDEVSEEATEEYAYDDSAEEDHESRDRAVAAAGPAGLRRWVAVPTLATAAAVLLVIGFIAASIVMVTQHRDVTQRLKQQDAFVAAAKQCVLNMISLDFTKARSDVQRVIDSSTGEFKDDFQKKSADLIALVEKSKAITEGTVDAAALESVAGNSAVVLVSAISRVTNSPPDKPEPPKLWRLRVTIADEGGQYKMSKVDYVQ
jgi:Mce-associated membrane protein